MRDNPGAQILFFSLQWVCDRLALKEERTRVETRVVGSFAEKEGTGSVKDGQDNG